MNNTATSQGACRNALMPVFLVAYWLLFPAGGVWADDGIRQPVKTAFWSFKPMSYVEDGVAKGIHVELLKELMQEAGLQYVETEMPIRRVYQEMATGNLDGFRSAAFESAAEIAIAVEPPIFYPVRLQLYGLGADKPPDIASIEPSILIVIAGYKYGGVLGRLLDRHPKMTVINTNNHTSAFRLLAAGRAPYVLDYWFPAEDAIKKLGLVDIACTEVFSKPVRFYVGKKTSNASLLVEKLNAASRRILARRPAQKTMEKAG